MNLELKKRIITSVFLLSLLTAMYFYSYILIISLIIISIIAWIEFYALISKIFKKKNNKHKFLRFLYKSFSLIYLIFLIYIILLTQFKNPELQIFIIYSILISVMTDTGGFIIGKIFKGKKLTKISPKKTLSGSIGSFTFSLCLIPFFYLQLGNYALWTLIIVTLTISLISQCGDLFISVLKRKSKVKNTSDILPGHGGILDRIDGIIFSIPIGLLMFIFL
jgi:phosphatidate cytidylyltransferase|tara:strand:+ start:2827 stop:3489 length:663 start_codon:yes stop_codon:yes gene_type:complete